MKKIIPSICMLLVTAVLMGTSTYAWFSMNKKVEVTGMKVTASTSSNMIISKDEIDFADENANNSYNLDFQDGDYAVLSPASSADGKNFFKASANASEPDKPGLPTEAKFVKINAADGKDNGENFFIVKNAYIGVKGVNGLTNLKVAPVFTYSRADATDAQKAIYKALRVSVAYVAATDGEKKATLLTANSTTLNWNGASSDADVASKSTTVATGATVATAITGLETLNVKTSYHVIIRIWLEGQDENCFANNTNLAKQVLDGVTIGLVFTAE